MVCPHSLVIGAAQLAHPFCSGNNNLCGMLTKWLDVAPLKQLFRCRTQICWLTDLTFLLLSHLQIVNFRIGRREVIDCACQHWDIGPLDSCFQLPILRSDGGHRLSGFRFWILLTCALHVLSFDATVH